MYCTNCSVGKPHPRKATGKFGLGFILETPFKRSIKPNVWEVEINDTPSQVENTCDRLLKWINSPPVLQCQCEANSHIVSRTSKLEETQLNCENFQFYRADLDSEIKKGKYTKRPSRRRQRSPNKPKKTKQKYHQPVNEIPKQPTKKVEQKTSPIKPNTIKEPETHKEPEKPKPPTPPPPQTVPPPPIKPASDPVTTQTVIEPKPVRRVVTDLELKREVTKPEVEPKPVHIPKLSKGELLDRLRKQRKRMEYAIHPEKFEEEPPSLPPLDTVDKSVVENRATENEMDNEAKPLYENINAPEESIEAIVKEEYDVLNIDE